MVIWCQVPTSFQVPISFALVYCDYVLNWVFGVMVGDLANIVVHWVIWVYNVTV